MFYQLLIPLLKDLQNIDDVTFWEINVTFYAAVVSVKQYTNDLKQIERERIRKNSARGWIKQVEDSTEHIRKEIAQLNVMTECKKTNTYSKLQLKLKQVFTKRYGDFRLKTPTI